jgi:hypothetical protein
MKPLPKLATLASLCAATAAFSQSPDLSPGTRLGPSTDPQQVLCVKESELGSRLRIRRVCRTRAEWREHRREVRLELDTILHPTK